MKEQTEAEKTAALEAKLGENESYQKLEREREQKDGEADAKARRKHRQFHSCHRGE